MCGIAGWFDYSGIKSTENPNSVLKKMGQQIAHRGPDGEGIWHNENAAFVHRRLAIIDIHGGQQPMHSSCEQISITFNGEIYNYQELRKQYPDYLYTTASDTETILALYLQAGEKAFDFLRGMFAFALWDGRSRQGFLVRDPQGIKPLVFFQEGTKIIFGSEAKALFAHPNTTPSLNTTSLHHCLNFRYIPGQETMFSGIKQIPPGYMKISRGSVSHKNITFNGSSNLSLAQTLDQSIEAHLVSDVPVGLYLSGGIDSGLVAEAVGRANPATHTFTMSTGDDPNEAKNAAESASIFGLKNTQFFISDPDRSLLRKLVWHLEMPKINALQVFLLAQSTSKHRKVALSGLGGDELFFGYNAHAIFYRFHQLRHLQSFSINSAVAKLGGALVDEHSFWTEKQRVLQICSSLGNWPKVYGLIRNVWDTDENRRVLYGERMLDDAPMNSFDLLEHLWPQHDDPILAMSEFELQQKMVNDLLWQEDRVSMAHGLEVRTPFIDSAILQHVRCLSRKTRFPFGNKKHLLRELASSRLPKIILNRKKSGFQINAPVFFHKELAALHDYYLSKDITVKNGIFNYKTIEKFKRLPQTKNYRWHYMFLYFALMTHVWMELQESQDWTTH
jgi:asparagine synthase (glutamine-hydrolysing)